MSIVDDFDAIRAGLDKIEKKTVYDRDFNPHADNMPLTDPRYMVPDPSRYFWGLAGIILRNKDTGEMIHSVPNTRYDLTIWEIYTIEGAL